MSKVNLNAAYVRELQDALFAAGKSIGLTPAQTIAATLEELVGVVREEPEFLVRLLKGEYDWLAELQKE